VASSEDVANYLNSQSIGSLGASSGWGIFVGWEPPAPDTTITIYDTGGTVGNPDASMYDPTIQVRVRGHSYANAIAKAEEIRDDLAIEKTARIIGDWLYTGFWVTADVVKIDTDEKNRHVFTVNFRLMRELYTTA